MEKKIWSFNPHEGDHAVTAKSADPNATDGEDVVFYIDDLNPEVVTKVVEMYNADKTTQEIDAYLKDEERCTQDEREFIIEQIANYLKITSVEASGSVSTENGAVGTLNVSAPNQTPKEEKKGEQVIPPTPPPQQSTPDPVVKTRQKRSPVAPSGGAKKASAAERVKLYEDKIALIKLLDTAETIEIPTGLGKEARDIMQEFQKEQTEMLAKYLDRVDNM